VLASSVFVHEFDFFDSRLSQKMARGYNPPTGSPGETYQVSLL
jgi:hypothetical protein